MYLKKYVTPLFRKQLLVFATVYFSYTAVAFTQTARSKNSSAAAAVSGKYHNLFKEAGYDQSAIDKKLAKAYYDLFEGPEKIYFEVGDSMAYVSDLKNHDTRTEGLSHVPVQPDAPEWQIPNDQPTSRQ